MTAMVPTNTGKLTGLVTDRVTNTNNRHYKVLVLEDTGAATGETYDLTNIDASVSGIAGPLSEAWYGVVSTAASTWSSTTITLPAQNGTYQSVWLCY